MESYIDKLENQRADLMGKLARVQESKRQWKNRAEAHYEELKLVRGDLAAAEADNKWLNTNLDEAQKALENECVDGYGCDLCGAVFDEANKFHKDNCIVVRTKPK